MLFPHRGTIKDRLPSFIILTIPLFSFSDGEKGKVSMNLEEDRCDERYEKWREGVLKKWNYTCQTCHSKKNMHAHHPKSWQEYPELRYDLKNGIALCEKCHVKFHPFMRKKKAKRRKEAPTLVGFKKKVLSASFAARLILKTLSSKKRILHSTSSINYKLKSLGYSKRVRKEAWEMVLSTNEVLKVEERVVLFSRVAAMSRKNRIKKIPASFILEYKKRAKENMIL